MKYLFKNFNSTFVRTIPSPFLTGGIRGKVLGQLAEMIDVTKPNKQNIATGFLHLHDKWYQQANSKTILIKLLWISYIFCSDPLIYREILGQKQDCFTNNINIKIVFGYFFKNSMIVVDGEQWQRIRKVVQRAINKQNLDLMIPIMCCTIEKLFKSNKVNILETVDLTNRITFDVFHKVMYGWDPKSIEFSKESTEILDSCNIIGRAFAKRFYLPYPLLWKIPTKENRMIDKAAKTISSFIIKFIAQHREYTTKEDNKDINSSLLDAMITAADSGEDGGMSNQELNDQIATLFFGAFDTTSNTLLFLLNYLARYPDTQEKLRNCILSKYPSGIEDILKSRLIEIDKIEYLKYFIDEVNRLHSFAPYFARYCIKDTIVGEYEFKKGTIVMIDNNAVGKDKLYWRGMTDLDKFRPERWAEYTPSKMESVLPFGFGGRICPGRKIAIWEMKMFLAIILSKYKVELRNPREELLVNMVVGMNIQSGNGNINFTNIN